MQAHPNRPTRIKISQMCGKRSQHSPHVGGATGLLTWSSAASKASGSRGVLQFFLQISHRSKVRVSHDSRAHSYICYHRFLSDHRPHATGELKILILGSADGRGRAALRLHENSDNGEDGCLWRMRSDDEGVLAIVKQILAA
jgi:hypothetical protein